MTFFDNYLGQKTATIKDGYCGEPIMWGKYITQRMDEWEFNELRRTHNVQYIMSAGMWMVIEKELTREDAIAKYGEITNEEFGPAGGWKSVTFGDKKFISKSLKK
jgi:hypothetical protein